MDEKNKTEELIYKLIEKRKKENDAFTKLLNAMGGTPSEATEKRIPANPRKTDQK